jgi:hypothetical protein
VRRSQLTSQMQSWYQGLPNYGHSLDAVISLNG